MVFKARLADRTKTMGTENAFEVGIKVAALEKQGKKLTKLHIGQPDFPTPENVKQAGIRAIQENKTGYTTANGVFELRQAVADYIHQTRGVRVDADNVVIAVGGKPILYMAAMALLQQGDEVIVPNPSYPIYDSACRLAGARVVDLPVVEETGFRFDHEELKKKVSPKTKLMIINTPANPTGGVLARDDLKLVRDLALEKGFTVLCDEIYSRIVYEGKHESICAFPELMDQTILLDGWSKTYSMTGWRLGYGVMPKELAKIMTTLVINIYSGVVNFTQYAGIEALRGPQDSVDRMVREFDVRRKLIVKLLNETPGVSCVMPKGAFYAFPNVKKICAKSGMNSKELEEFLLYKHDLAVLSGTAFGSLGEGYLRFSYAASQDDIRAGVEKMRKAFERL